jgi:DsbC/DsbD-like thiol-disulfide interchange protein
MTNLRSLATALFVLLAPAPLFAGEGDEPASVRILPGWQSAKGHHFIGVEITLEPGWKTYWRAPGEAGIPPYWDWSGSENVADLMIHWPVPEVFDYAGMDVIGYHDQVVIPIEIRPSVFGSPVRLAGHGEIGVCQEICVPFAFDFALDLKEGGRKVPAIIAAMIDQPVSAETAKVETVTCQAEPTAKGLKITAKVAMPSAGSPEVVVIEAGDSDIWVSGTSSVRVGDVLTASAEMMNLFGEPIALNRSAMRITVLGSDRAVDILGCPGG